MFSLVNNDHPTYTLTINVSVILMRMKLTDK